MAVHDDPRPTRSPQWPRAVLLGLLSAAVLFAIPRGMTASSIGWDGGRALRVASSSSSAIEPRARPRCPGCGVIESVRELGESAGARDDARPGYEVTVRFRDGTTTTFDAAGPRLWRVGSRVNVLGAS